jgi:N-methylhydantoinase A
MRTAVDIGGTFTDVLILDTGGVIQSLKVPTQQDDLALCFLAAVRTAVGGRQVQGVKLEELLYSTTLSINSLLGQKLPRVGLIVNEGFRELMETARLPTVTQHDIDPPQQPQDRLVQLEFIHEIKARLGADGTMRHKVDSTEVTRLANWYEAQGISVVAVSLLHSYLDPQQEKEVAAIFASVTPEIDVVLSSDVLPELREYERTLATCLNASLMPGMKQHVERVIEEQELSGTPFLIMKSSGGLSTADSVVKKPLTTALSGPSAAVVGMAWLGNKIGFKDLITLDIGGTSTDVSMIKQGVHESTRHGEIGGLPFKTPMVDVLTIGAGGGSIASRASDERWHVGPESAGAYPGPVCYGQGGERVTLTDSHLVLGRLPRALLAGQVPLDFDAAYEALGKFGAHREFGAADSARGILEIATHNMCGAIRKVSVQRGYDPREYALLAVGGAGPLHAAELARLIGIETVVVPAQPGLAAAFGLLVADIKDDFVHALGQLESSLDLKRIQNVCEVLVHSAERFFTNQGISSVQRSVRRQIDIKYAGLSNEMSIDLLPGPICAYSIAEAIQAYHERFSRLTGYSHEGREEVELVNLRLTAIGQRPKPDLPAFRVVPNAGDSPQTSRPVAYLEHEGFIDSRVYRRADLKSGLEIRGPCVVEQYESTVIVPPEFGATTDAFGNLILRGPREPSQRKD